MPTIAQKRRLFDASSQGYEPDPYFNDVKLLLGFDYRETGTTFKDFSKNNHTIQADGAAAISFDASKFGVSSASFDGSNSGLKISNTSALDLSYTPYTCETWVYLKSASIYVTIFGKQIAGESGYSLWLVDMAPSIGLNGNYFNALSATQLNLNQWYHIAIVDDGSGTKLYVNGSEVAATTERNTTASDSFFIVGQNVVPDMWDAKYTLNGYLQELRITKGVARYTSNFIPPTRPFYRGL